MTSMATVVFKSGAMLEIAIDKDKSDALLSAFYEGASEAGVTIALNLSASGNAVRALASDISAIFIDDSLDSMEEDEEEDEDGDDEDFDEDDDDDEETTLIESRGVTA